MNKEMEEHARFCEYLQDYVLECRQNKVSHADIMKSLELLVKGVKA